MNNSNTPPISKPTPTTGVHWKKITILMILAVVIIVGIVLLASKKSNNPTATNQPSASQAVTYSYKTLVNTKVGGTITSLEFKRPKEFSLAPKDSTLIKGEYVHSGANGAKQLAVIGAISAYTIHYIIDKNPLVDLTKAQQAFNDRQNSDYQAYLKSLNISDFLASELAHRYFNDIPASQVNLNIQRPSVLTTTNLKDNAWLFGFTAQNGAQANGAVRGDLVFALGKSTDVYNGYNYLMLSTLESNWQPNQAVWQQVLDSIKINE